MKVKKIKIKCVKCGEGTLGKPKYCASRFGDCIHRIYEEHLFRVCNTCKFTFIEPCKDKIYKEVYEKFGGKE